MNIGRIIIIIMFILFVILVIIPPPSPKFKSVCNVRKGAGLFSIFTCNHIGAIIYCKEHGINNIYINYKDVNNKYTNKDMDVNNYLVSNSIKDNGRNFNIFQQLHNLIWKNNYGNYLYGSYDNREKFPVTSSKSLLTIHNYIKDSFDFKPKYYQITENFLNNYKEYYIIGVHYRGGDTIHHYPFVGQKPEWFITRLEQLTSNLQKPYKILVCTIDNEFIPAIESSQFKDDLIYFNNNIQVKGSQTSYANWENTNETGIERAENVIMDCLLLSKCDYIIKNRSNISDVSLLLNPHIPCTVMFYDKDVYLKNRNEYRFSDRYSLDEL